MKSLLLFLLLAVAYATVTPQELEAARVDCANRCRHNGQIAVRCMQQCWAEFFKSRQTHHVPPTQAPHGMRTPPRITANVLEEMLHSRSLLSKAVRGAPPVTTAPAMATTLIGCWTLLIGLIVLTF